MSRLEQVNALIQNELAALVQQYVHIDGVMLTISWIECTPDLKRAKVYVSVLPDSHYGTALEELREQSRFLRKKLSERVKIKFVPRLVWQIDNREMKAAKIEEALRQAD